MTDYLIIRLFVSMTILMFLLLTLNSHSRQVFSNGVTVNLVAQKQSELPYTFVEDRKHSHQQAHPFISANPQRTISSTSIVPRVPTNQDWSCEDLDFCEDKSGFDAVLALHRQLDDDANGNVDVAESDEFLRDELHYENGYERQKGFHGNDKYISVDELWKSWKLSEVHNWTVEETVEWLSEYVELPQYARLFQEMAVDGSKLPRMAISNMHYLGSVLGIKDPIHKQKIALKAMDVVLFGPPKFHNYMKDVLLAFSLVVAIGGCWFAYVQHNFSQKHLKKMMKDMDSLSKAEESLMELQNQLDHARKEQANVTIEKQLLEQRLQDEINIAKQHGGQDSLREMDESDLSRVELLEEELQKTKDELKRAQKTLDSRAWVPPTALQHWLQLTYELEQRHYNTKKVIAEQQLFSAKDACERLKRKRTSFMGSFRIAHGNSIDDVDNRILQAKAALSEVTKDLQERLHRWHQIELLCGFSIVHNPGILYLESMLQGATTNGKGSALSQATKSLLRCGSEGDLTDDNPPPYSVSSAVQQLVQNSAALFLSQVPPSFLGCLRDPAISTACVAESLNELRRRSSNGSLLSCVYMDANGIYANGKLPSVGSVPTLYPTPKSHVLSFTSECDQGSNSGCTSLLQTGDSLSQDNFADVEDDDLSSIQGLEDPRKVDFIVGDGSPDLNAVGGGSLRRKMVKSFSQDNTSLITSQSAQSCKTSHSESSLDDNCVSYFNKNDPATSSLGRRKKQSALLSHFRVSFNNSPLDEENSTDSNSTIDEDAKLEKKKKSSLLHGP